MNLINLIKNFFKNINKKPMNAHIGVISSKHYAATGVTIFDLQLTVNQAVFHFTVYLDAGDWKFGEGSFTGGYTLPNMIFQLATDSELCAYFMQGTINEDIIKNLQMYDLDLTHDDFFSLRDLMVEKLFFELNNVDLFYDPNVRQIGPTLTNLPAKLVNAKPLILEQFKIK